MNWLQQEKRSRKVHTVLLSETRITRNDWNVVVFINGSPWEDWLLERFNHIFQHLNTPYTQRSLTRTKFSMHQYHLLWLQKQRTQTDHLYGIWQSIRPNNKYRVFVVTEQMPNDRISKPGFTNDLYPILSCFTDTLVSSLLWISLIRQTPFSTS